MEPITLGQFFRTLSGEGFGFILALSLASVAAAALLEIGIAARLLVHFRSLGPVRTDFLHDLKVDWDRRELPILLVRWVGRVGIYLAFALTLLAAGQAALEVYRLGGAPTRYGAWRLPLAEDLVGAQVALWVFLMVLGVRTVVGGIAGLVYRKAAWYVRAGDSLPDAGHLARLDALSDALDEDIEDTDP
ncbi:MAG: hypothetical protein ABIK09_17095 [Pseudomonadota bacterium]